MYLCDSILYLIVIKIHIFKGYSNLFYFTITDFTKILIICGLIFYVGTKVFHYVISKICFHKFKFNLSIIKYFLDWS